MRDPQGRSGEIEQSHASLALSGNPKNRDKGRIKSRKCRAFSRITTFLQSKRLGLKIFFGTPENDGGV
jgi:hypothetical protein